VFLNGVPIDNPVRNQQLDNMGNFSIFNAEIVGNQYIYPSNPPLDLGHSIAGVVDIRTTNELAKEAQTQLSVSLAQVGLMHSHKLGHRGFVQFYSNAQTSGLYKKLNMKGLDYLHHFSSIDAGMNTRWHLSRNSYINLYSYYVDEGFKSEKGQFNYYGTMTAWNRRQFNVLNWLWHDSNTVVNINASSDFSRSHYKFGFIQDSTNVLMSYLSGSVRKSFNEKWSLSAGSDMTYCKYQYTKVLENLRGEYFANGKYVSESDWQVALYLRGHAITNSKPKLSIAVHFRKNLGVNGEVLASVGKYHTQQNPGYYIRNFNQLSSDQTSVDYRYHKNSLELSASVYAKREHNPLYIYLLDKPKQTKNQIFGNELSGCYRFLHCTFNVSYAYIKAKLKFDGAQHHASNDKMHLLKASFNYENVKICNLSLSYVERPGIFITPYGGEVNSKRLTRYRRLDLTVNRYFMFGNVGIVTFFSATNLLNRFNVQYNYYNDDYSQQLEQPFQRRLLYCGITFHL
jgi:hypothetical protein